MSSALFHLGEKTALACSRGEFQKQPSGRESAPGAREKRSLERATRSSRDGTLFVCVWGPKRGRRGQCRAQGRIRLLSKPGGLSPHRSKQPGNRSARDCGAISARGLSTVG